MTVKQPDLSFTQNPQWIAERETHWGPIEGFLKENNRKEVVEQLKKLFFTGVIDNPEDVREGFAILYYPLQTAEAWDYLFQDVRLNPKCFKEFMNASLMGSYNEKFFLDDEARLRFFDYFHPATYQPVIKSRVPIGREQKIVQIEVDRFEILRDMAAKFSQFLGGSEVPVIYYRLDYFFSFLDEACDVMDVSNNDKDDIQYFANNFLQRYFKIESDLEPKNRGEQKAFLVRFYNHIANNPVHPSIKAIWQKVLDEHD
ncbi:hypothetical protein [Marinagarivorans algicola]|uniref:hypothetical protein n=1 Tax=Marinagarivorans algicola TaxID=1513270 RepID=UPI0006B66190|nr:hypothetical protein [Marinagarivorans algicola]